tara:strand:+ start:56 stop:286 length:231 start_codon:yes stop_codon:yes gene_type:complete
MRGEVVVIVMDNTQVIPTQVQAIILMAVVEAMVTWGWVMEGMAQEEGQMEGTDNAQAVVAVAQAMCLYFTELSQTL